MRAMPGMTFIKLFVDYLDAIEPLGDAERGRLFTALLEYARTGEAPQLGGNERFLFPMMRAQIDRNAEDYKDRCEKLAENGRKGGRPPKTQHNQKKQLLSEKPTDFLETKKSQDKEKDKEEEKEKEKEKKEKSAAADASAGRAKGAPKFSPEDRAYQAAVYLDKQIQARLGQQPVGEERLQSWATEFDLCHRIDGHSWEDIGQVLRFSQMDAFWSANILSGRKFREKYVQLLAKMRASPGGVRSGGENKSYDIDELEAMSYFDLPENL